MVKEEEIQRSAESSFQVFAKPEGVKINGIKWNGLQSSQSQG